MSTLFTRRIGRFATLVAVAIGASSLGWAGTATAQPVVPGETTIERINRFIQDLEPPIASELLDPAYRANIRRVRLPATEDGLVEETLVIDTNAQVSLAVNFAFDSAQLTEDSAALLADLGRRAAL